MKRKMDDDACQWRLQPALCTKVPVHLRYAEVGNPMRKPHDPCYVAVAVSQSDSQSGTHCIQHFSDVGTGVS
jgi:hypothetical protein